LAIDSRDNISCRICEKACFRGGKRSLSLVMKLFAALLMICTPILLLDNSAKTVPPNINMSHRHGNEAETAMAVSHTNPLLLTTVSNLDSGNGTFHAWSTDGGRTWNNDIIADGDALGFSCCDGQLAADDFGNIFFVYLSSSIAVKMAISTDGGATFQPLQFLDLPFGVPVGPQRSLARVGQTVSGDQPSIAAGAGSVWISWTASDGSVQASGAPVSGLGQVGSFSPAQRVSGSNAFGDYGDTAIGPNGEVFIVYQTPTGGQGPATVYGALDPDGLGPQGFGPGQLIVTSNVGGFDYIPAQSGRSIDIEAGLAWDRTGGAHNGRLYFIYTSEEPQESNNTDIQFRYSDDKGATWSNDVRVNDDTGTTSQFNPRISLDSTSGNVAIAWYDCRNDRGDHGPGDTNGQPNDDAMIYATVSRDGGATFVKNRRLSVGASNDNDAGSGVDYGDYSGFYFYNGKLYFSAADNSNSTGDNPDGTLHEFDLYVAPTAAH
jgi:hypothetical protein